MTTELQAAQPDRGHLLRVLGVTFGVAVVVGGVIGQGILRTPGVVAEGLFLSNDEDAAFIQRPEAQDTIVGAYERAILAFLEEPSA